MFNRNQIEKALDDEIAKLQELMDKTTDKNTDEYAKTMKHFETLMNLRKDGRISAETWATVGANLAGIFLILNHERAHVIASKGFTLVKKLF